MPKKTVKCAHKANIKDCSECWPQFVGVMPSNSELELREKIDHVLYQLEQRSHKARIDSLSEGQLTFGLVAEKARALDAILAAVNAWHHREVEKAVTHAIVHIMGAKTEGLFDDGQLFIKRAPIEQAVVDLIGFGKFKAIQDSLPATHSSRKPSND